MANVFHSIPGLLLILQPNPPTFTIVDANEGFLQTSGIDRSAFGKPLFEVFPDNPADPGANGVLNLSQSLLEAIGTKKPSVMDLQRYDNWNNATKQFDVGYWSVVNIPVLDKKNKVVKIIHSVENKTEQLLLKQSEENIKSELQQLHHLQHSIIENLEDGYISVDKTWTITNCNKHTELLINRPCTEAVGNNLFEQVDGIEKETFVAMCKEVLSEKKPKHFEIFVEKKDRWLIIHAYPSDEGLFIFLIDNTGKKNEQKKLNDNEKRFRTLVENIADGIIILGPQSEILELSQSAQNILNLEEDILKQKLKSIFFQDDIALLQETFDRVVKTNVPVSTIQFRLLSKDGTLRWLEGTFQNLLNENLVKAVILICRDITDRKLQEEQLKLSEEKYRTLFQSSPATIIIWTLNDFRIREVNQSAIDLYGYTLEEFQSMTVMDIRPVEEQQRLMEIAIEMRETKVRKSLSVHLNRQQKRMYMNATYFKLVYDGEPAIMTMAVDQSEKIQLERKLEKERKRRLNEITEAVISAQENEKAELSKELHDNINQILTTTRLMVERGLANKMSHEEVLQLNLQHLTTAIEEIRKLSQSLMPPSLNEITLADAIRHMISDYNDLNLFKISYTNELKDERILTAPAKLTLFRIIQEQLNNIIKHSGATNVELRITHDEQQLRLKISDNGKGFIVNSTNKGLGLKNITSRVHLFNGRVSIHSEIDKGTELNVEFRL